MLTQEEDIDIHALRKRGWTISAIARHTGRDRKTVRAYLAGDHVVGQRASTKADGFAPFVDYCRSRLGEDPHLWASTLFDELLKLGFTGSYPTLTRQLRERSLRPVCSDCAHVKDRAAAIITHEPGEETQWDWLELPDPPPAWGWGANAHLLVGSLAHSSRWRAVLAEAEDQPHLIDGLDRVTRALGGATKRWRFDRMATVCHPATGRVTASFAAVAKHYGVQVAICPPRAGNRKGVVEKANHVAAQRWWRTLADDVTVEAAQASLDDWCRLRGDTRVQRTAGGDNVATVAAREPLADITGLEPFPAVLTVERKVTGQALVPFRGNFYSVPPELAHGPVAVTVRLGGAHLEVSTTTSTSRTAPVVVARHRIAAPGSGVIVRDHGHVAALEQAAMTAGSPRPHRGKTRIPPGPDSLAAAAVLRGGPDPRTEAAVIDLAHYAAAAAGRNTLT